MVLLESSPRSQHLADLSGSLVQLPIFYATTGLAVVALITCLFGVVCGSSSFSPPCCHYYAFDASQAFSDQLYYLLRGISRAQASCMPPKPKRIPISLAHLRSLFQYADSLASPLDSACFKAAFTLAFFGLLRISEFTCPSPVAFDPRFHLTLTDVRITLQPHIIHVHIKQSKTDPFRQGCTIRVARTGNLFCPFQAMINFLSRRPPIHGPLFLFHNGSFLTRDHIRSALTSTFPFTPPSTLGTHSFRIGGASMLCCLGVPDATIQVLGRWSSSAFRRYLRISDQFITRMHARAASNEGSFSRIWHPLSYKSKPAKRKR